MPTFKVKVKWGKETYPDVEANTDEDPLLFKAQLFALTGVQPERQKVMLKGTTLRDTDWGNVKLKDGATVLLMGSKEEDVPKEPVEKTLFVEDMSETEIANALDLPAGLINLGNTCYMNATVQCLKTVPELKESLKKYMGGVSLLAGVGGGGSSNTAAAQSITAALRDLYDSMERRGAGSLTNAQGSAIHPLILLQVLHTAFPRFAEKSDHGGFVQQDANECWTEMVRMLQQKLPPLEVPESSTGEKPKSLVEQFFGGTHATELKCVESEDEPVTHGKESFLQLSCFISQDVRYMLSGLRSKMQEQITKYSPTLERDAVYTKTSKISRLPAYLTVQFVRFYFKEKEAINAKILKDVKFPLLFDAFELCSSELQQKLTPMRAKFKELEDKRVEDSQKADGPHKGAKGRDKTDKPPVPTKKEPYWFTEDIGSNNSGYYQLQAVLTHQGRSSSSGHYVAWVRQERKTCNVASASSVAAAKAAGGLGETWLKCDDEAVVEVTEEDILKLSGGGDWHCAYVLLYGPRVLEVPLEEQKEGNDSEKVDDTVQPMETSAKSP
ncbi:ubiquitin carboxyl-terminal hydrolase 14 [Ischnura elegans]|uniref:ubiquitin carboxyl-terminal hydrolase 14 n=1 Tax=Ischnura elegans TaxID=197161 RepID=UPI001ED8B6D3|nr:ubiquitin carboxyl-terminal hydrolase 14 [Ischnura elegans]